MGWFERKFGEPPELPGDEALRSGSLEERLIEQAKAVFERKCERVGRERLLDFGRALALRTIDIKWKDHLHAMDVLQSGIGLRSYAQLDPKLEYKSEGGAMFEQMLINIADEVTDLLFRVQVEERTGREVADIWQVSDVRQDQFNVGQYAREQEQIADSAGVTRKVETIHVEQKVGRNDPCPCGSGRKFKHCCGRPGR